MLDWSPRIENIVISAENNSENILKINKQKKWEWIFSKLSLLASVKVSFSNQIEDQNAGKSVKILPNMFFLSRKNSSLGSIL